MTGALVLVGSAEGGFAEEGLAEDRLVEDCFAEDGRCVAEWVVRVKAKCLLAVYRLSIITGYFHPDMTPADDDDPGQRLRYSYHGYVRAPDELPAFADAIRVRPKGGRARWKDRDGYIYEWDSRHGALEVYDGQGRHLGEYDHMTGRRLKMAEPRRRIEP